MTECAADLSPNGSMCFGVSWNGSAAELNPVLPKESLKPPVLCEKFVSNPEDLGTSENESLANPLELKLSADELF